ncbi:hypothetical protein AB9K34_02890 [Sedimentitalea sp. XS_ASV28]|uniref:hypothetical protein n=1 Tax=Sedimentitalea sp. XS_ASV28 TaxID=3241296 RepID=UPI003518C59D
MLAHLVLSIAFGLIGALTGALTGGGLGSILLYYFVGGWAGFIVSIALQLILSSAFRTAAATNVRRATS